MNIVYHPNAQIFKVHCLKKNGEGDEHDDDIVSCLCGIIDDEIKDASMMNL